MTVIRIFFTRPPLHPASPPQNSDPARRSVVSKPRPTFESPRQFCADSSPIPRRNLLAEAALVFQDQRLRQKGADDPGQAKYNPGRDTRVPGGRYAATSRRDREMPNFL